MDNLSAFFKHRYRSLSMILNLTVIQVSRFSHEKFGKFIDILSNVYIKVARLFEKKLNNFYSR